MSRQHEEKGWQALRDRSVKDRLESRRPRGKTPNQEAYLRAMSESSLVICTGPAGSGKTFLACAYALQLLGEGKIKKIVLSRPTVECAGRTGKGLGFMPGDKKEKLLPHMRALRDVLVELGADPDEMELRGQLEMEPIEFMRGVTLRDSFVVLDEAQNCSYGQLHMFLTRIGRGARMVICGDRTRSQNDLEAGMPPLAEVIRKLSGRLHRDASIVRLTKADIQRHELVRWVDEMLGEEEWDEGGGQPAEEWFDGDCPWCGGVFWYEDGEEDADLVECCHCSSLLSLFDENGDQNESVCDLKGVRGKKTMDKKPA